MEVFTMSEHSLTRQAMEAALRALEQQVQEEQAGTINSWLCPHFESCDPEGRIYTCSFALRKEYANPGGTLHGGLVGVIFDTAMGHLSALYAGGMTPTVTMNISYLRPVPVDGPVLVRSRLDKPGQTINYISAEAFTASAPEKILAPASGAYLALRNK